MTETLNTANSEIALEKPTETTTGTGKMKLTIKPKFKINGSLFKFPFQRRARSLSLPKGEKDSENKESQSQRQKNEVLQQSGEHSIPGGQQAAAEGAASSNQQVNFKLIKRKKETSPSPGQINDQYASESFNSASKHPTHLSQNSNKPIIAKDNFVLAHKNLVPGVMKLV